MTATIWSKRTSADISSSKAYILSAGAGGFGQKVDRVRRLSILLLQKNGALFSSDFQKNKEALAKVATIKSKQLRNEVAGYITALLRREEGEEEEVLPDLTVTQPEPEIS